MLNVRCMLKDGTAPSYATIGSAGADVVSNKDCKWEPIYSEPFNVASGLKIPDGYDKSQKSDVVTAMLLMDNLEVQYEEIKIIVGWKCIVSTGVHVELPKGYELQVRPRSGSAFKHNVSIINAPGTVDEDYRGEIKVALTVTGELAPEMFVQDVVTDEVPEPDIFLPKGMKIAQFVVSSVEKARFILTDVLGSTARGDNGFGSTGVKVDYDSKGTDTKASVHVEFNVGDIHLLDVTMGTMARMVKSLTEYNKDFKGVDDVYATDIPDDKMMFVTYDVYEFDYNKQDLFDRIKSAVDLLGGKDELAKVYSELPEKKKSY